ncbi:hypothetical protein [Streptomyces sp. NPDC001450]
MSRLLVRRGLRNESELPCADLDASTDGVVLRQADRLPCVGFCDAGGLNVFLEVSQHLAASEGELRLHRPAPVVSRLLDLTGTGFLLAEEDSGVEQPPAETAAQPSSEVA